jgi:hypothetical protein
MVAGIRYVDSYVTLGVENVVFQGRPIGSRQTLDRLAECGVAEALVAHNAAVEGDPATGNRLLSRDLADHELSVAGVLLHPAWVLTSLSAGDLGSPEELRRRLGANRVRAAFLYPEMHGYSGSEWSCGELYGLLESMQMPLFTRLGTDFGWDGLHTLLTNHPRLRLVIRNCDYRMPRNIYRLFDLFEHLAVESGRYSAFGGIEEIVRRWGAGRVVYGSGAPGFSPGAAIAMVALADVGEEARRMIAGGNLLSLMDGIRYDA